jgi:hypothetical protein
MTARVYWARIALVAVAVLGVRIAEAQQGGTSTVVKTMSGTQQYAISRGGWLPPVDERLVKLAPPAPVPERVVITYGPGGLVDEHNLKFAGYRSAGNEVEIRGGCHSACTLVAAYVGKDKLCFASGAYLAFHAVRSLKGENLPLSTGVFYRQMPADIRSWIDRTGGWENLPLDGFWYMRAPDLWAIGYPRCK